MSKLLNINVPKGIGKEEVVNRWIGSGFLDNLQPLKKRNIAELYESEASALLNESKESFKEYYKRQYNNSLLNNAPKMAKHYLYKVILEIVNEIKTKHCEL